MADIAGYIIYYGERTGDYPDFIEVDDSTAIGYKFTDFAAGVYYMVLTTYDTQGRESQYSSEVILEKF